MTRYASAQSGGWCASIYQRFEHRYVHCFGFTDAFLARTAMEFDRPSHKEGLIPLSVHMTELYTALGVEPQRGLFRRAAELRVAQPWVARNLEVIERIEQRVYNDHDFLANLRLALSRCGRIDPLR